jgi:hypothetical protein
MTHNHNTYTHAHTPPASIRAAPHRVLRWRGAQVRLLWYFTRPSTGMLTAIPGLDEKEDLSPQAEKQLSMAGAPCDPRSVCRDGRSPGRPRRSGRRGLARSASADHRGHHGRRPSRASGRRQDAGVRAVEARARVCWVLTATRRGQEPVSPDKDKDKDQHDDEHSDSRSGSGSEDSRSRSGSEDSRSHSGDERDDERHSGDETDVHEVRRPRSKQQPSALTVCLRAGEAQGQEGAQAQTQAQEAWLGGRGRHRRRGWRRCRSAGWW